MARRHGDGWLLLLRDQGNEIAKQMVPIIAG